MYNVLCILTITSIHTSLVSLYIYTTLKELYMVLYSPSYGLTLAAWFLPRKQPPDPCVVVGMYASSSVRYQHWT